MIVLDQLVHAMFGTVHGERFVEAAVDTILLTAISAPLIYFFAVRPFERERDRARNLLTQEVQKLEEAQMIGRVGSWQFDDANKTIQFSKEALVLLGLDEARGVWSFQDVIERVHEDDQAFVEKFHSDMLANDDNFTIVYRVKRQDGGERWIRERGMLARGSDGIYRGTILDISEAKAAEAIRKRFVSTITHELRTPLTAIKGSFGLLKAIEGGALAPKAMKC